jgi:probable HAF family extracellular repeat protein
MIAAGLLAPTGLCHSVASAQSPRFDIRDLGLVVATADTTGYQGLGLTDDGRAVFFGRDPASDAGFSDVFFQTGCETAATSIGRDGTVAAVNGLGALLIVDPMREGESRTLRLWDEGASTHFDQSDGTWASLALSDAGAVAGHGEGGPRLWLDGQVAAVDFPADFHPRAISDTGHVVGVLAGGPAVWQDGVVTPLPLLGQGDDTGLDPPAAANDVNDAGLIVGYSPVDASHDHGVLWRDGEAVDLGTAGSYCGQAVSINSAGQIVGWERLTVAGEPRAAYWEGETRYYLDELIASGAEVVLTEARFISQSGQILAEGHRAGDDVARWYLLTPTANGAEPSMTRCNPPRPSPVPFPAICGPGVAGASMASLLLCGVACWARRR